MDDDAVWLQVDRVPGWLSRDEAMFLRDAARDCPEPGLAVEIGTWQGRSAVAIACGLRVRAHLGALWAIDPHRGTSTHRMHGVDDTYELAREHLSRSGLLDFVMLMRASSAQAYRRACERTPAFGVSLLWIDGDHEYEGVWQDFTTWGSRVVPGGIIALHDRTWPGVDRAAAAIGELQSFRRTGTVGQIAAFTRRP